MVPSETMVSTFVLLTPNTSGDRRITAKFRSNELNDVDGFVNVTVAEDFDDNNNLEGRSSDDDDYNNNNNNDTRRDNRIHRH